MTHDELPYIAIIEDLNKLIRKQMKAIDAVMELHKPQEITLPDGSYGQNCSECDNQWGLCPTLHAIYEELG